MVVTMAPGVGNNGRVGEKALLHEARGFSGAGVQAAIVVVTSLSEQLRRFLFLPAVTQSLWLCKYNVCTPWKKEHHHHQQQQHTYTHTHTYTHIHNDRQTRETLHPK